MKKTKELSYSVAEPSELLPFLLAHVTNRGRNSIKSLLAHGQVAVNDQVVTTYNFPLQPGQKVSILPERKPVAIRFRGLSILHEDDDIIVIHKDAGLLSISAGADGETTAYRQLTEHVRRVDARNRIFVVHRLDRDTSGVMLFAKSEKVKLLLQDSWQETVQERTYIALVEGAVKRSSGTISSWLKESKTLKMFSSPQPNGGQHAVTHYKVIQSNKESSLLEVNLETGRKNQIRVHMQDLGHPIVGDKKYGAVTNPIGRLGLHARILAFMHPITQQELRFATDIPREFLRPFHSK